MKKRVSIKEFKEYCEDHKPNCISFLTENQRWYRVADPCEIKMSFSIILILENPNLICLKSADGTLLFNQVKFIEIDTESSMLGTVFTIFCGDFNTGRYDITYTLVAVC